MLVKYYICTVWCSSGGEKHHTSVEHVLNELRVGQLTDIKNGDQWPITRAWICFFSGKFLAQSCAAFSSSELEINVKLLLKKL